MKERISSLKPDYGIHLPIRLPAPMAAERGVNPANQLGRFRAQFDQAQKIADPALRQVVITALTALYSLCGDWRIYIVADPEEMKVSPGRADGAGVSEGTHYPVVVKLPFGVTLAQVLPYIK